MLVQHRVAAERGVKNADAEPAFDGNQQQRDPDNRRGEHLDPCRRIERPDEQRHLEKIHSRRTHAVNGGYEIQTGHNRRNSENESRHECGNDVRRGPNTVRHIKGPTGIRSSAGKKHRSQCQKAARNEEPPRQQVEAGKEDIPRTDHQRKQKVAEHRRKPGNDEQENHYDPVQREHGVVGLRLNDGLPRREHLQAHKEP